MEAAIRALSLYMVIDKPTGSVKVLQRWPCWRVSASKCVVFFPPGRMFVFCGEVVWLSVELVAITTLHVSKPASSMGEIFKKLVMY